MNCWDTLGIKPTSEIKIIKKAYAGKLKVYHPEDDSQGFQRLRKAYEDALKAAKFLEADCNHESTFNVPDLDITCDNFVRAEMQRDSQNVKPYEINNINMQEDQVIELMNKVQAIYNEKSQRNEKDLWKELLDDDSLVTLDVKEGLRQRLWAFLRENHDMSVEVLLLLNEHFGWTKTDDKIVELFFSKDQLVSTEINHINLREDQVIELMKRAQAIYSEKSQRNEKDLWKELLDDERLLTLDVKEGLRQRLWAFLQENHDMSVEVLLLLNEHFGWTTTDDEIAELYFGEDQMVSIASKSNSMAIKIRAATILFNRGTRIEAFQWFSAMRIYFELMKLFGKIDNYQVNYICNKAKRKIRIFCICIVILVVALIAAFSGIALTDTTLSVVEKNNLVLSEQEKYYKSGIEYAKQKQYDLAIADFSKVIELEAESEAADAYFNRANAYAKKGQHDLAIADYKKAITIEPNLAEAYTNLGIVYSLQHQDDLALDNFNKAIEIDPKNAGHYSNKAILYQNKRLYKEAIDTYRSFILKAPEDTDNVEKARKKIIELGGNMVE